MVYPTDLDSFDRPTSGVDSMDSPNAATLANEHSTAIEALEGKVGTGSGTPTAGKALVGGASAGASEWSDEVPVGDGTLSVGDLLVVKSLNPMVVEGVPNGTYVAGGTTIKGSDETVNNSAAVQDDDALVVAVAANEDVKARFVVVYSASTNADLRYAFTAPAGASGLVIVDTPIPSAASTDGDQRRSSIGFASENRAGGAGAGTKMVAKFDVIVRNGATGGNLTFRWSQFTAEVSDCVVYADSHVDWRKVV